MKAIKFFVCAAAIATMMGACGSKEENKEGKEQEKVEAREVTIPVSEFTLEGEDAEYFELVGEGVTFKGTPGSYQSDVEATYTIKPTKKFEDFASIVQNYPFSVEIVDANGNKVGSFTVYSYDDQKKIATQLENGTFEPVDVKVTSRMTAEEYNKFFDGAKSGKVMNIDLSTNSELSSKSSSSDKGEESSSSSYSGPDYDELQKAVEDGMQKGREAVYGAYSDALDEL